MPPPPTAALSSSSSLCLFPFSSYSSPKKTQLGFCPSFPFTRLTNVTPTRRLMTCSAVSIEKETLISHRPHSFLRETDGLDDGSVRSRFQRMIMEVQDSVCGALEAVDGAGKFKEDAWTRPGGGGGISRVLQDGDVFEKAGVNISVVYGVMPPEAYRAAKANVTDQKPGPVPFFAAGISSVLHPKNPFAPTLHFNYRYFETDAPKDAPGAPRQWWFGGGTDLTPSYIFEEDVKHFHSHRDERRGLGGIFFDDLNDNDQEMLLSFATGILRKENVRIPWFLHTYPLLRKGRIHHSLRATRHGNNCEGAATLNSTWYMIEVQRLD
ncbi:coproporphyrinogen-III oxidase 2, chloroplastic isoform X4 [Gossypium hirsutum]|uniref:coproporphyrinogen oxidase n=1 Tax=Gossypium hirsutum TaxID=3635 RepID=A0ABM3B5B8_GOSHI|nr:coproporphyrinogen-III oxidase 2, chloroplastic isoform X4 [Gossypium hirsutum]